ncbi:hypothetical protein HGP16_00170 [Rhizobium sp. P40RR-XXII]|uniref:hypothetical protein n=1 Tax=unclassified Rhizobium TaxID=2613769 RepID=UPI00145790D5|nr:MULTISPECIES: hypothetical protein [unclassified Rhizobium]NLR84384.1 hypothetical protein [Rhizobium sp. P28RR-XV]NLS14970.1 hypothetical protein [Rhizobium sp. P40RR-XXII]
MSGILLIHVVISLIAIVSGVVVAQGFLAGNRHNRSTLVYMLTTVLTSLTGFLLPFHSVTPAIIVGTVCLLIFIPTALARYRFRLSGIWRPVFVIGALVLLFFNCLVLIVQSFQKISVLNALAPNGNEPPILAAQVALLVVIVFVGFFSLRRFHPTLMSA